MSISHFKMRPGQAGVGVVLTIAGLAVTAPAGAETTLELASPHVPQGSAIEAAIRLSSTVEVAGVNGEIEYPSDFELGSVTLGSLLASAGGFSLRSQINSQSARFVAWSPRTTVLGDGPVISLFLQPDPGLLGRFTLSWSGSNPNPQVNSQHAASNSDGSVSLPHAQSDVDLLIYSPTSDFDGDGMPDEWEVENGLDPLVPSADEDTDGDGSPDREEFEQGTDPRDPGDSPVCLGDEFIFCDDFEPEEEAS